MDDRDGDFDGFVRARHHALIRFAFAITGDLPTAEDLVQNALERTGARWNLVQFRQGNPEAYVRQAIVNGNRTRWRSRRREHLVADVPDVMAREDDVPDRTDAVWQALRRLPRRQRAVLVLRFCEDFSVHDTADLLRCSEGTIKSQTSKALATLRAVLKAEEPTWT